MIRLLFAWDAAPYGGHDVTALMALERLAREPEYGLGVLHTGRNPRLTEELAALARRTGRIEVGCAPAPATPSESIDGLFRGPRTRALRKMIRDRHPDWVVNVQGFITLGLCVLGACRDLKIPVVSFVPMTHRIWTLHPAPLSLLQDAVNLYWYSVPTAFLTISDRMKDKLVREHGLAPERIGIAACGPDLATLRLGNRSVMRRQLGWTAEAYHIGVIGRLEFAQKGQDFLIRAVARHRDALAKYRFHVIGDGPDLNAAQRLVAKHGLTGQIDLLPWQSDMSGFYAALDAILIPSRYEGVPLVMLEAMARRLPVLAAALDGMADILPGDCLFRPGAAGEMVDKIRALPDSPGAETLARLASLVETRLNAKMFADCFAREIGRLLKEPRR